MMKLNFRVGEIVRIILGTGATSVYEGKVTSIDDNEVVLIPQIFVATYEWDERWGVSADRLDPTMTVDCLEEIHINRELISAWSYYKVPVDKKKTTILGGVIRPSELHEYDEGRINYYENDGFCTGKSPSGDLMAKEIGDFIARGQKKYDADVENSEDRGGWLQ